MSFVHDTLTVFRRQLRLSLRTPAWVVIALLQPILYLVLFAPLLTKLPAGTLSGSGRTTSLADFTRWLSACFRSRSGISMSRPV